MNLYIIFSIGISALFFCINNGIFNWFYNIVMSLLVLFLFLLRIIPSYRFERLKNIFVFSVVAILFLMMSILAVVVRHEALLFFAVFFHELIFFILSLSFIRLTRVFVILAFGLYLASSSLLSIDLQVDYGAANWLCIGVNIFLVMMATILTYSTINIFYLNPPRISVIIFLYFIFLFFIVVSTNFDGTANWVFTIIAFSFLACSILYAYLVVMSLIFRTNNSPDDFFPNKEEKF